MTDTKLPASIREGWVNLPYAQDTNQRNPDMNRHAPGAPYFVGGDSAVPGQWIRVVLRPARGGSDGFWCVADVEEVIDPETVRFGNLSYENGPGAPAALKNGRWRGVIRRDTDGAWIVAELAEGIQGSR